MNTEVKKILILGATGFIGSNFLNRAKKSSYKILSPGHKELDLLNLKQLRETFDHFVPEVVINFAAHRDANSAELQRNNFEGSAWKTNVEGVKNLNKISSEFGSFFIHISTDMVFSGNKDNPGPYDEDDQPETKSENLSWYGWTKAQAEKILENTNSAIIRIGNVTQPVYDPKLDYVGKILYLSDRSSLYPLFNDQYLTLSYIPSIFEVIEILIKEKKVGIFHVASKNIFNPYELGRYLTEKARGKKDVVKGISMGDYLRKWPNRYPKYGGLLIKKTASRLGVKFLDWEEIVDLYIEKLKNHSIIE